MSENGGRFLTQAQRDALAGYPADPAGDAGMIAAITGKALPGGHPAFTPPGAENRANGPGVIAEALGRDGGERALPPSVMDLRAGLHRRVETRQTATVGRVLHLTVPDEMRPDTVAVLEGQPLVAFVSAVLPRVRVKLSEDGEAIELDVVNVAAFDALGHPFAVERVPVFQRDQPLVPGIIAARWPG